MWWIGLLAGTGLASLGLCVRWRVEAAGEGREPDYIRTDLLIGLGISIIGLTSPLSRIGRTGFFLSSFVIGAVLTALGMAMRPKGKKVAWSWRLGFAENSTRTGKTLFFVGWILALFGGLLFFSSLPSG